MLFLLIMVACATLTAYIAKRKNRNVLGWFIFGGALAIVALPIIILIDPLKPFDENEEVPIGPKPKFHYSGIAVLVVVGLVIAAAIASN